MHAKLGKLSPALAMAIGAGLWGIIWYPMRELEAAGLGGLWLTLMLYASAWLVSIPGWRSSLPAIARHPGAIILLMLSAGWTNIAFVEAVLTGNILRVLLLFYLAPLWQTLLGWLILREHPGRFALGCLALSMSGALIMLWDTRVGVPWPQTAPDWYALSSGFAFAVSNIVTRGASEVSIATKSQAIWLGVVLVAGAMLLTTGQSSPSAPAMVWGAAALLGVVGICSMTWLVQVGVSYMPAHRSAIIALVELLVAAISQHWLTDEVVRGRDWFGGLLIVIGATLAVWRRPDSR